MAVDLFLKLEDVPGESRKDGHDGEIDILSFSYGVSNGASWALGGGGAGTGKSNLSDISIMKYIDKSSASFFKTCSLGDHFASATIIAQKAGGSNASPIPYYKIELTDVLVANVSISGSDGSDLLTESISLAYKTIKSTYTEQADDGTGGATTMAGYDVSTNKPI